MKRGLMLLIFLALIIASCSGGGTPQQPVDDLVEPTPVTFTEDDAAIVVQGHLVPAASTEISFPIKGQVAEVLVQEGAAVKAGDVLARLANQEALDARLADAKLDLLFARQNYDDLQAALPEAQTTALEELYVAQETLRQVEATVGSLTNPGPPPTSQIEIAQANVAIAKKSLDKASNEYRPFANKPEDNITRATLLQKLASAQDRYDRAVARLNSLLGIGTPSEAGVSQAETELTIAQSRLAHAQAVYDLLLQGPDPKEVETANARIEAAEKAVAAAEAALKGLELRAPMDGVVANLNLTPGQYILEGQPAMMLVDFSQWYLETDTMLESQVVNIAPDQPVSVVPASISNVKMDGVVEQISTTYQEFNGNVTYTVRVRLNDVDPRLRWGMKMMASFENPVAQK